MKNQTHSSFTIMADFVGPFSSELKRELSHSKQMARQIQSLVPPFISIFG